MVSLWSTQQVVSGWHRIIFLPALPTSHPCRLQTSTQTSWTEGCWQASTASTFTFTLWFLGGGVHTFYNGCFRTSKLLSHLSLADPSDLQVLIVWMLPPRRPLPWDLTLSPHSSTWAPVSVATRSKSTNCHHKPSRSFLLSLVSPRKACFYHARMSHLGAARTVRPDSVHQEPIQYRFSVARWA